MSFVTLSPTSTIACYTESTNYTVECQFLDASTGLTKGDLQSVSDTYSYHVVTHKVTATDAVVCYKERSDMSRALCHGLKLDGHSMLSLSTPSMVVNLLNPYTFSVATANNGSSLVVGPGLLYAGGWPMAFGA